MPIQPNQLAEKSQVLDSTNPLPPTGPNKGTWGTKLISGVIEGFYKDDQGREIQMTEDGEPKANSNARIGPVGPQGPQGNDGPQGDPGNQFLAGSGVPGAGLGNDGDLYLDTVTADIYEKSGGSWSVIGNISGGPVGPQGPSGSSFLSGSGVPAGGLGNDGDTYLDEDTGLLYAKSGGSWSATGGDLSGPQGPAGADGATTVDDASYNSGVWLADTTQAPSRRALAEKIDAMDADIRPLANQAEAEAGTANDRSMSPLRVAEAIAALETGQVNAPLASQAEAEAGAENTKTMTALRTSQAIAALGGDMFSANNLSDVASAPTALSNLNGLDKTDIVSQAEAESGTATVARAWTAQRVNQAIQSLAPGGGGNLLAANNLSDVANAATALSNLSGLDATNIVPQAEAEAGTATTARTWTAQRVGQAIAALAGSGSGDLLAANNLSDVANASTSLTNLGGLAAANNLSDVANAATALSNLSGLDATNIVSQAEAEAGIATTARVWTAERVNQAIQSLAPGGGGNLLAANNLSDVANAATALSNLSGLDATNIVPQAEAEAGTATTARTWTAQRVGQAIAALAGSGSGDLLAANNLSDVANAATSLSNLGGLAASDIVSQAEAEAGTATTARVWTAQRVNQAIQALAPAGGATNEFKIFLVNNATLAGRIADGGTTSPAGWTIQKGDDVAGEPFTLNADTLIVTHNLAANTIAVEVRVFEHTGGPAAVANINQVMPDISSVGTDVDTFKNNSGGTKFQIKNIQTNTTTTKDLTIYIKMYTL